MAILNLKKTETKAESNAKSKSKLRSNNHIKDDRLCTFVQLIHKTSYYLSANCQYWYTKHASEFLESVGSYITNQ